MKQFQILILFAAVGFISACGGGGRRVVGQQCAIDHQPFIMNLAASEVSLPFDQLTTHLNEGTYKYLGSTLYYIDKKSDFRVQIAETQDQRTGKLVTKTTCTRNTKSDLNVSFLTLGIGDMVVKRVNPLQLQVQNPHELGISVRNESITNVRSYGFTIRDGRLSHMISTTEKVVEAPKDAYDHATENFQGLFIKKNDFEYEVRTIDETEDGKHYLSVRLLYVPPPPPKKTN